MTDQKAKMAVDSDECRHRLLAELTSHIGEMNAIGMPALYQAVYDRPWSDRINDTRRVRRLVTAARHDGMPICSDNTGYWLSQAGSEVEDYTTRLKRAALKKLRIVSRIKKISLPKLCGQLEFDELTAAVDQGDPELEENRS